MELYLAQNAFSYIFNDMCQVLQILRQNFKTKSLYFLIFNFIIKGSNGCADFVASSIKLVEPNNLDILNLIHKYKIFNTDDFSKPILLIKKILQKENLINVFQLKSSSSETDIQDSVFKSLIRGIVIVSYIEPLNSKKAFYFYL